MQTHQLFDAFKKQFDLPTCPVQGQNLLPRPLLLRERSEHHQPIGDLDRQRLAFVTMRACLRFALVLRSFGCRFREAHSDQAQTHLTLAHLDEDGLFSFPFGLQGGKPARQSKGGAIGLLERGTGPVQAYDHLNPRIQLIDEGLPAAIGTVSDDDVSWLPLEVFETSSDMMSTDQDLFETVAKQIVAAMQATTFSIAFPGAQMGRIDQMDPSRKRRRHRKRFALAD